MERKQVCCFDELEPLELFRFLDERNNNICMALRAYIPTVKSFEGEKRYRKVWACVEGNDAGDIFFAEPDTFVELVTSDEVED